MVFLAVFFWVLPFPAALSWQESSCAWNCAGGEFDCIQALVYADATSFLTKLHVVL